MIKYCTCGKYPDFKEKLSGWQVSCSNCSQYLVGWATKKAAINAWNAWVKSDWVESEATLAKLLTEVLVRGFYGTASVKFTIQDGMIQRIQRKIKRK